MRAPPGYVRTRTDQAILITTPRLTEFVRASIAEAGTLSAYASRYARATMQGRGPVHVIDALGGTVVVRHYQRGGAIGPLLNDRYLRVGEMRPVREMWLSTYGRARGVRTPRVAAVVIYPAGIIYRADIATVLVPDSITLADATFGADRMQDDERISAWRAAGDLVRTAAQAGMIHRDLNLRNILLARRDGLLIPHLLDLDNCRLVRRVPLRDLRRMTARVRRSADRFIERTGTPLGAEWDAFAEAAGV